MSAAGSRVAKLRHAVSGADVSVSCVVFSIVIGVCCRDWWLAVALGLSLVVAAVVYPGGLHPLLRLRTWILLTIIMLSSTLVGPDPLWSLGPLGISPAGAVRGVNMAMRALIIIVAVTGLVSSVPIDRIGTFLERFGLRGLGFAVGVAFNLLPLVERSLVTSWQAMRLRAGLRRPFAAARLMLVAAVSNCLRCADEVSLAAEARAFSPQAASRPAIAWRARTVPLVVILIAMAGVLVWIAA
jgi:energy-coupling factor transporter transmembrane protein EcfT